MPAAVNIVVLADGDNVGIATRDIATGEVVRDVTGRSLTAGEAVPLGHKIALCPIAESEEIRRYGFPVGVATAAVAAGRLVHVHNVRSRYLTNDEDHYE